MEYIYLSRRNLLTLLSKLDRQKAGEHTFCAIIKSDVLHDTFPQTIDSVMVTAVEDQEYYNDRQAGFVLEADDPSKNTI